MEIKQKEDIHGGKFFIEIKNETVAAMVYSYPGPGEMIIEHTVVGPELKGSGTGKKMVEHAVLFARKNNLKILPLCPFAKSVFNKTPEYQDVLTSKL